MGVLSETTVLRPIRNPVCKSPSPCRSRAVKRRISPPDHTRVGRFFTGSGAVCSAADEKTDYTYDSQGRLSQIRYPNGITGFIQYDAGTGQVKEAGYRRPNGTLIYRDEFVYVSGTPLYARITRTTATESRTTRYTYDAWQQLLSVTEEDGRRTVYQYDAFGNRTRETITNLHDPEATGGAPKPYGDYVYEYGANGNRLTRILKEASRRHELHLRQRRPDDRARPRDRRHHDLRLRPEGPPDPGDQTREHDQLHLRCPGRPQDQDRQRHDHEIPTAPHFGMSRVLAELDTSMNFRATYVYGGHQLLKEEPVAGNRGEDLFLLADGIVGSVTHAAVGPNGQIKNEYAYDAFGIRTALTTVPSASHGHYGYTGQEYDAETGLLYLRARYYDPTLGRFISADPYWGRLNEPASQNRYAYVHNNPLMYTDPSGLCIGPLVAKCAQHVVTGFTSGTATFFGSYATNEGDFWGALRDAGVAGGVGLATGAIFAGPSQQVGHVFAGLGHSAAGNSLTQLYNMRFNDKEFSAAQLGIAVTASVPVSVATQTTQLLLLGSSASTVCCTNLIRISGCDGGGVFNGTN